MTLNELMDLANNGDLKAMQELGEYYLNINQYSEAWEWFSKSADRGFTQSIVNAAFVGMVVALTYLQGLGDINKAIKVFKKTLEYSNRTIQAKDVPQNVKKNIADQIPAILFQLGYCLYIMDSIDESMQYLTQAGAKTNPDCQVVLGLCYFDKGASTGSFSFMKTALPLLKGVDHASLSENEDVKYMAYMNLSQIYRLADELKIPGLKKDIGLSYEYCLKASHCGNGWGEKAQKELRKYKKGLFGGYSYKE